MKKLNNFKKWLFIPLAMLFGIVLNVDGQITLTSVNQAQSDVGINQPYGQGTTNQRLLRIDIVAGGSGTPLLNVSQLDLNITGSEAISKLTIIRGENSNAAIPDIIIQLPYAEISNPGATESITLTGADLGTGTTRIFVLIDVKTDAVLETALDVECTNIVIGGTSYTPNFGINRNAIVKAPYSGVLVVGTESGDAFATIRDAFTNLNFYGMAPGGVELVLKDDEVYEPVSGNALAYNLYFRQPSTQEAPLIIRRSGTGTNRPVIQVNASASTSDHAFGFIGSDYVVIDGLEVVCSQLNGGRGLEYGFYFLGAVRDGCKNNEIKNNILNLGNGSFNRSYGVNFYSRAVTSDATNDNNKIHSNEFSNADAGVAFNNAGSPTTEYCKNNEIYNNIITGTFGIEAGGICLEKMDNVKVYGNTLDGAGGVPAATTVRGIRSANITGEIHCYNNIVRNINNVRAGSASIDGIALSASKVYLYNNMVSNLNVTSAATGGAVSGIVLPTNTTVPPVYYLWNNSVYLSGTTPAGGSSASLNINGNQAYTIQSMKNNIFVNTSNGGTANRVFYSQYKVVADINSAEVDNNLYYPEGNQFIYFSNSNARFNTFADYLASTVVTFDKNAISELPPFVATDDLHLQENVASGVIAGGIPVTENIYDIDGALRSINYPTIGAHELFRNKAPEMDAVDNQSPVSNNVGEQTITLSGLTDSDGGVQTLTITAVSSDATIIPNPTVTYVSGSSAELKYTPAGGQGNVTITVTVKDNGGTANGGEDTKIYTFEVPVGPATGLADIAVKIFVHASKGVISVHNAPAGETIEVYNALGRKIASQVAVEGLNTLQVAERGVVVLKIGNQIFKSVL